MQLVTSDNVRLEARHWPAERDRRATVVLVHGFSARMSEPRVVSVAHALRDAGFDVLGYDARGHGASEGETTLGARERLDVAAAVAAVPQPGPVVLVGASMGAIASLRFAAAAPGAVAGIVSVSCPSCWRLPRNARGVLCALLTQTRVGRDLARRRVGVRVAPREPRGAPPVELVGGLGIPLAIVHGREDPFIPVDDADRLFAAAAEPRRVDVVEGLGHAFDGPAAEPVVSAVGWCLAVGAAREQPAREPDPLEV